MESAISWFSVLLVVFVLLLSVACLVLSSDHGYWQKQGVPCPKPWPLLGNLGFKPIVYDMDMQHYKKFGRFYGFYLGSEPTLYIAEPELISQVTVKDFWKFPDPKGIPILKNDEIGPNFLLNLKGENWKRVRNVMTPSFTTGKLKQMTYLIEECCKSLVLYLDKFAQTGEPFDVKKCMSAVAMDIIANCAFGTKVDSIKIPNNDFVQHARNALFPSSGQWKFIIVLFFPKLVPFIPSFLLAEFRFSYLKKVLKEMIVLKKQNKHKRKDFLDLLLEAKAEEEGDDEHNDNNSKKFLSPEMIAAQSILFLLAGHDTTATTLSFSLYHLALHPEVQNKLAEEVDRVMDRHDDKLEYEAANDLNYTEMVISETLRLYPPAPRTNRICTEDGYKLGGASLRKGMMVSIPIYCIHRDPGFYPMPEKFDPERFSAENKAARNPMTYLPFGTGPRHCIGMRFALIEAKITLASIIRNFRITRCAQTQAHPEFEGLGLMQPKKLTLTLERRRTRKH